MSKQKQILHAVNVVIAELSAHGFTIQRYDAWKTNSVYLKLDYGLGNSIRFSDHPGKKHLQYMFNVLTNFTEGDPRAKSTTARYYYGTEEKQLLRLVSHLVAHRDSRVITLGVDGYAKAYEEYREMGYQIKTGFWSQARVVHKGTLPKECISIDINKGVLDW